ncbi:UDP-glucuronic acid dehydrogenase [Salinivibrio sp. MA440]|uniref:formyltransferase family protein n=1 Tax=Salinivibrio sp. MA440 TaxID=1909456 RepID=UPI0009899201|nr:formyltransferase family protein [Salinivibrio sp. MA440]OOF02661.1 UDP-glucuronic acid dehydrogenase [Salinivibrio sp. MA440]
MRVTIICSSESHPIYAYLQTWCKKNEQMYDVSLLSSVKEIEKEGDILFLVSCSDIVRKDVRDKYRYTLVLHASDLPKGRGWSPHIWDIINGSNVLTLSMLNAEDNVDTGDIWKKVNIHLDGTELYDEINHKLFNAELALMDWACQNIDSAKPMKQTNDDAFYHRKRTPQDSLIDINDSISSQFNLLRVSDPERYPAYFHIGDQKYKIKLEKVDD